MNFTYDGLAAAPRLRPLLVISHDACLRDELRRVLQEEIASPVHTVSSYREAEQVLQADQPGLVLIDLRRSATAETPVPLFQRLSRRGAARLPVISISDAGYLCEWAAMADLLISGHLQLPIDREQLARLLSEGTRDNHRFCDCSAPRIVEGRSVAFKTYTPEMFPLLDELVTVAAHDVTALLVGGTGTGKTTLARLIHELSSRREAKLLTVACGALPPEIIESELFGHVRGAFTSAEQTRMGKFEAAKNGTLLLDEIDVLSPGQQAKLLRVIETGEYEPVGSNDTRISKARLLVASNVDLKGLVERNAFRADLYYRLNTLELYLPPLRERPRDIVPLALDFIDELCRVHDVQIRRVDPGFLACLKGYHWPGNVRELKNHVRRAVLFCRTGVLTVEDLGPQFHRVLQMPAAEQVRAGNLPPSGRKTLFEKVASSEREILEKALQDNNLNRTATALALGLSRVGLYKKMKKHGLLPRRPK